MNVSKPNPRREPLENPPGKAPTSGASTRQRTRGQQVIAVASLVTLAVSCKSASSGGGAAPEVDCESLPAAPVDRGGHWVPGPIGTFQIAHFESLGGLREELRPVDVLTLELDQVEKAGGREVSDLVHAQGTRLVCYTSTGYEDWRADASSYPKAARGGPICQDEDCSRVWPGEAWGDITSPELLAFLTARTARAAAAGCDGIEFDNMDQAFNRTGLDIRVADNVAAAHALAQVAHDRGLAALAKNAGDIACALAASYDGVFIEECQKFGECDIYRPFAGKLVAMVEYDTACVSREWAVCQRKRDYFED
jgi:hypothetical protein